MRSERLSAVFWLAVVLVLGAVAVYLAPTARPTSAGLERGESGVGTPAPRLSRAAAEERAIVAARGLGLSSERPDDVAAALMTLGEYEVLAGNAYPLVPTAAVSDQERGGGTAEAAPTVARGSSGAPAEDAPLPPVVGPDARRRVWVVVMKGRVEWSAPGTCMNCDRSFDYITVVLDADTGEDVGATASRVGRPLPLDLPGSRLDERRVVSPAPEPTATLSDKL